MLSSSDEAGFEAVHEYGVREHGGDAAQEVDPIRGEPTLRTRDAAVQHCLEVFGFQHPGHEFEGSILSIEQFEMFF